MWRWSRRGRVRGIRGKGRRGDSRRQGSRRRGRERSREVKDEDLPEAGYARGSREGDDSARGREGERRGIERDARVPECLFEFLAKWPSVRSAGHPSQPASRSQTKSHGFTYYDLHPCPLCLFYSSSPLASLLPLCPPRSPIFFARVTAAAVAALFSHVSLAASSSRLSFVSCPCFVLTSCCLSSSFFDRKLV